MKKSTALYAVIAVLVATNVYLLVQVVRSKDRKHPPPQHMTKGTVEDIKEEFGFSEDQMRSFVKSKESHEEKIEAIEKQLAKASKHYYLDPEGPNDSLMANLLQLSEAVYNINYQHFDEVRAVCDDDQEKTLINLITNLTSTQRQSKSITRKKPKRKKR